MKNALKNWWNKPWTNGTYVKCCAGGTALALIIGAIYAIYLVVNATKEKEMHEEMINLYGYGTENSNEVEEPLRALSLFFSLWPANFTTYIMKEVTISHGRIVIIYFGCLSAWDSRIDRSDLWGIRNNLAARQKVFPVAEEVTTTEIRVFKAKALFSLTRKEISYACLAPRRLIFWNRLCR